MAKDVNKESFQETKNWASKCEFLIGFSLAEEYDLNPLEPIREKLWPSRAELNVVLS